ncbi:hypothetical protein TNCV_5042601 [Trichonephila clavipes]|nr:hypothetical protein TNCV_5042601 [Trichonephila clavipes]
MDHYQLQCLYGNGSGDRSLSDGVDKILFILSPASCQAVDPADRRKERGVVAIATDRSFTPFDPKTKGSARLVSRLKPVLVAKRTAHFVHLSFSFCRKKGPLPIRHHRHATRILLRDVSRMDENRMREVMMWCCVLGVGLSGK